MWERLEFIREVSLRRIAKGYQRGQFSVAVPFNPRDINEIALGGVFGLVLLFVTATSVTMFSRNWWFLAVFVATLLAYCVAITVLENAWVELPEGQAAQDWQFDNYGYSTRCGIWRPLNTILRRGLSAPYYGLCGLVLYGLYSMAVSYFGVLV